MGLGGYDSDSLIINFKRKIGNFEIKKKMATGMAIGWLGGNWGGGWSSIDQPQLALIECRKICIVRH